MSTHTPGPYRVADDLDRIDCIGVYASQMLVCELRDPEDAEDRERMRANAAFIVRACNAHEELLAAARNLLNASRLVGVLGVTEVSIAEEGLEKIIAKAEGRA